MSIREKIVEIINDENYRPLKANELAKIFGLSDRKNKRRFFEILDSLEREGLIIRTKNGKYNSVNSDYLVVGTIQRNEKGFGFLIPEDREREDIFIPKDYLNGAMNKDKVVVAVLKDSLSKRKEEGEVIRILERKNKQVVGTFTASRNFGFLIPDDVKLGYDIFIPKSQTMKAKHNQKVVVEITKWPEKNKNPEGKVIEILGYLSEKGTDILSLIRQYDLPEKFPKEVIDYVDNINQEVTDEDIENRIDLRDKNIMTIDGFDAKDLDDAISIEKLENGNYLLGVHIADVSHYVKENSILDKNALERGNSVYLLDRVIPMLPRDLSNGICSLNPGEDRLCLSIIMEVDKKGNTIDHKIAETVINSKKRLVYDDVSDYLEGDLSLEKDKLKGVEKELKLMEELAKILQEKREIRGSIDFNFPESRIILDEEGVPIKIEEEERRIANRIIEEFMLLSNETISEQFYWLDIPFLYRIHEEPDSEKIEEFKKVIYNLGYSIKGQNEIHSKDLQQLLKEVEGKNEESLISMLMLRSLKKAKYSEVPDIHFGLSTEYYSHFTAPIRRYADLTIHRIIKKYINGNFNNKTRKKLEKELPDIAEYISLTERRAEEAEREVEDMKKAEYMMQYIGYEFTGYISSLTNFGIFVELENTVEGLIRYADMKDDFYHFDEENYLVIGEQSGRIFRLGEEVKIVVSDANIARRSVDFILVD